MPQSQGTRFTADPLTFIVRQQLWDANVEDHSDQGVSIEVAADIDGKQTTLLRFNCFDIERSYVYGPENPELTTAGRVGGGMGVHCRMDPVTDGNPIGWTIRNLGRKLPQMLERAGYKEVAEATDLTTVRDVLPDVEACARETLISQRNTVKHNRGTEMFEAGNIRFGLEMRRLKTVTVALRSMFSPMWADRKEKHTSKRRSFWHSIASGRTRITIMVHAIRTTGPIGPDRHRRSVGVGLRTIRE